jgi:peptidyl-tRNA hydrolase
VSDHVLSRFSPNENKLLDDVLSRAHDAAVMVLCKGVKEGMNEFNRKEMIR